VKYLLILLAIVGIVLSALALREHYNDEPSPCSINDKWDCGIVNKSPYAVVGPIPVAALGILGYAVMGILAVWRRRGLLVLVVLGGLAFSLYLTYIEAEILGVWCIYCVGSLITISLFTLLSVPWWYTSRGERAIAN
jgi:vitamin-K-epoxide reductase (warfarin-sensitive)